MLATVRKLGLAALLARSPGRLRDLVIALLVGRVIDAQSKLATARALTPESAVATLGEMLDLGTVDPKADLQLRTPPALRRYVPRDLPPP